MDFSLKLPSFEGPMDLLLHLIEKNKVSIYDIPIALIADQFLECVDMLSGQGLEDMSEFLVMAAHLLDIKSRMLLPPEKDEEGEEIDPREELAARLLEYKLYKDMSQLFRQNQEEAEKRFFRDQALPPEVAAWRPPADIEKLLGDVTLAGMEKVFRELIRRQAERTDPERSNFGEIKKDTVNVVEVMRKVGKRLLKKRKCTFRSLISGGSGRIYTIVAFLSILELIRTGQVEAVQDKICGEIMISVKDPEALKDGLPEEQTPEEAFT